MGLGAGGTPSPGYLLCSPMSDFHVTFWTVLVLVISIGFYNQISLCIWVVFLKHFASCHIFLQDLMSNEENEIKNYIILANFQTLVYTKMLVKYSRKLVKTCFQIQKFMKNW